MVRKIHRYRILVAEQVEWRLWLLAVQFKVVSKRLGRPSLTSFPNVTFEAVPMLVWLTLALSHPLKVDRLLPFSTPLLPPGNWQCDALGLSMVYSLDYNGLFLGFSVSLFLGLSITIYSLGYIVYYDLVFLYFGFMYIKKIQSLSMFAFLNHARSHPPWSA